MAFAKTNAMRQLDAKKVKYQVLTYDASDAKIDGLSVADKINQNPNDVYKTLITVAGSKKNYVFIIPVLAELDFKKAARLTSEKKIELLPVGELFSETGYIRGGCSPIGMKKLFPTFVSECAYQKQNIIVSGGKIGIQIQLNPNELLDMTSANFADVIKE
ncbi:MAG: Cys-tRNA(Pro) deacylase [Turicibacter sp.]